MSEPKDKDSYTIVIFRGATSSPLRFSFPRVLVRRAMVLGACLILAELLFLSQYVVRTGQMWELDALREEILSAREQTTVFSNAVRDLKQRLLAMQEINQKLRVMLGIPTQKSEDLFNGRGGGERPLVEGEKGGAAGALEEGAQVPDGRRSEAGQSEEQEKDLASHVKHEIAQLQTETVFQERTLQELTMAANEKRARWASTPSVWPVKGWVTSHFGPRISPFTGEEALHDGLDIGTAPNTPVQAPAAGTVAAVGFDAKMGNIVNLEHGYGFQTQYGHLAKVLVKKGQKVKRGDVIGLVGSTGFSTGPHLHYLLKVNNQPVNPQFYILN